MDMTEKMLVVKREKDKACPNVCDSTLCMVWQRERLVTKTNCAHQSVVVFTNISYNAARATLLLSR